MTKGGRDTEESVRDRSIKERQSSKVKGVKKKRKRTGWSEKERNRAFNCLEGA